MNLELISEISVDWGPVAALSILGVLINLSSIGQLSWASDGSSLTLSHLLKRDIPALAYFVVTKSENFWLSLLESARILNELVSVVGLVVDGGPVISGTEMVALLLLGSLNLDSSHIVGDLSSVVSNMVVFSVEFDYRWSSWVLPIDSGGLGLSLLLGFLLFLLLLVFLIFFLLFLFLVVVIAMIVVRLGSSKSLVEIWISWGTLQLCWDTRCGINLSQRSNWLGDTIERSNSLLFGFLLLRLLGVGSWYILGHGLLLKRKCFN